MTFRDLDAEARDECDEEWEEYEEDDGTWDIDEDTPHTSVDGWGEDDLP